MEPKDVKWEHHKIMSYTVLTCILEGILKEIIIIDNVNSLIGIHLSIDTLVVRVQVEL